METLDLINRSDLNTQENLIGSALPELEKTPETLPTQMRLFKHTAGAILGEEDIGCDLVEDENASSERLVCRYSGTVKCVSQSAVVYVIKRANFLAIKDHAYQQKVMLAQCLRKTKRHLALDLDIPAVKANEITTAFGELSKQAKNQFYSKLYRRQVQNPLKTEVEIQLKKKDEKERNALQKYLEKQKLKVPE